MSTRVPDSRLALRLAIRSALPSVSWPTRRPTPSLSRRWAVRSALRAAGSAAAAGVVVVGVVAVAGCGSVRATGAAGPGAGDAGAGSSGPGSPTATSGGGPPGSATSVCAASGLRVRLDSAAAGVAAGSYYVPLEFINTSGHDCRLTGYPAVAFTSGAAGQQIGAAAAADHAVRASAVVLSPGGVAHAWLQVLNAADYPASKCHPVTAAGLRVAAPGTASASYLAHPVAACKAVIPGSKILTVHPVQLGAARRGAA